MTRQFLDTLSRPLHMPPYVIAGTFVVLVGVFYTLVSALSLTLGFVLFLCTLAMLVFVKPYLGTYVYVMLILPTSLVVLYWHGVAVTPIQPIILLTGVCFLFAYLARTVEPYPRTDLDLPLFLFLAWGLLSVLWSHNQIAGYGDCVVLFHSVVGYYLVVATAQTPRRLALVVGCYVCIGMVDAGLTLAYTYTDFGYREIITLSDDVFIRIAFWTKNFLAPEGRSEGFGTSHSTAATLAFSMTFTLMYFFVAKKFWLRAFLFLLTLIQYAASLGTLSKGPFLALFVGLAVGALHIRTLKNRLITLMVCFLLVTIVSFMAARAHGIVDSIVNVGVDLQASSNDPDRMTSLENRLVSWRIGIMKLWDTAGVGTGIGGFNQYLPYKWIDGAHPVTLFDLGILGATFYVWVLAGMFRALFRALRRGKCEYYRRLLVVFMGGYVTILISWMVSFSYTHTYLYFFLGVGMSIARMAMREDPELDEGLPFSKGGKSLVVMPGKKAGTPFEYVASSTSS